MEDTDSEEPSDWASGRGMPRAIAKSAATGFYRSRNEAPGGYRPVLLALEVSDMTPRQVREVRPVTGMKSNLMLVSNLQARYVRVDFRHARSLWCKSYEQKGANNQGLHRIKTHYLLSGLILPTWGVVAGELQKAKHQTDRKMRILRMHVRDPDNFMAASSGTTVVEADEGGMQDGQQGAAAT